MSSFHFSMAKTLVGACGRLMPARRHTWLAAMNAELDAIETPHAALVFASGCVWASVKERITDMGFASKATRFCTLALMLFLAIASALSAVRVSDLHAPTGLIFGVSSVLFAATAAWSLVRGPVALVQAASTMTLVYGLAFLFMRSQAVDTTGWTNLALYRALSAEGLLIWLALLAGGAFLLRGTRNLQAS